MQAGMTKCEEERWTPSLQSLKAILARTQLLNDSRPPLHPPPSPPPFWLSPSPPTLRPSAFTPHLGLGCNDRPFNYLPQLIAADCSCRELFRLCWNYSLNGDRRLKERDTTGQINYPHEASAPFENNRRQGPVCRSMKRRRETASS